MEKEALSFSPYRSRADSYTHMRFHTDIHDFLSLYQVYVQALGFSFSSNLDAVQKDETIRCIRNQKSERSLNLLGLMIGELNAPTVHLVQLNAHIDTSLDKLLDVYPSNSDA